MIPAEEDLDMDTGLDHKKLEVLERAKATGTDFVHLQFTT